MGWLRSLQQALLFTWAGALLSFGALFAPALFRVLTPSQAGSVVRQVVPALDVLALVSAPLGILLAFVYERHMGRFGWLRAAFLGGAVALALASSLVVTPRLAELRRSAGDRISELSVEDPIRREFGRLHGVSTGLLGGQLFFALLAAAMGLRPREEAA